jgi:two-component system nitrogen regulation response regulator NtrX
MEDLRPLADAFMTAFCKENGLRRKSVLPEVFTALERRSWPGNVRELKNVIERAAILSGDVVTIADLPEDPHENPFDDETHAQAEGADEDRGRSTPPPGPGSDDATPLGESGQRLTLREHRDRVERRYIVEVLASLEWNISRTAIVLGVERTNLHKKIRAYGIKRGEAG